MISACLSSRCGGKGTPIGIGGKNRTLFETMRKKFEKTTQFEKRVYFCIGLTNKVSVMGKLAFILSFILSVFPADAGENRRHIHVVRRGSKKSHRGDTVARIWIEKEGVKNIEVEILVKVLNTTISFEKSLNEYLISEYPINEADKKNNNFLDMNVIEEIQSKYAEKKIRPPNRKDPNNKPRYRLFRVIGIISESFEPYMNSYVTNEVKKIKDIIINLMQNDRIEGKLYVSSLYLFNNIKQAMTRCLTFSKSKTFFDLSILLIFFSIILLIVSVVCGFNLIKLFPL